MIQVNHESYSMIHTYLLKTACQVFYLIKSHILKIYIMTQRLNSLYDSRISVIQQNHQLAIEHEASMLSKYNKNRYVYSQT